MGRIIFDPILPVPFVMLLVGLLVGLTVYLYWQVGSSIGRWRNLLLLLFRTTGILWVMVLLLQPSRQEALSPPSKDRVTLIGVDTSLSMKQRDVDREARLDAAKNLL